MSYPHNTVEAAELICPLFCRAWGVLHQWSGAVRRRQTIMSLRWEPSPFPVYGFQNYSQYLLCSWSIFLMSRF